ncbi:MAG: LPS-assembly protein LptD [Betaproteobacteria bacterium]|nr:LPS-assembly protein LptD [Betaproteobacteria bacterium]
MRFTAVLLGFLAGTCIAAECPLDGRSPAALGTGLKMDPRLTFQSALPSTGSVAPTGFSDARTPMYMRGDQVSGQMDDVVQLRGSAEMRQLGSSLKADAIDFALVPNSVVAVGGVKLFRDGDLFVGPRLELAMGTMQGYMDNVRYEVSEINGRGTAERVTFLQPKLSRMSNAIYTTCPADRPAWSLRVRNLLMDQISEEADAEGATFLWGDTPIADIGDFSFPVNNRRRTGFLAPSYAATSRLGLVVKAPFYWNMAPNRDMTLYPTMITRRGVQLGTEFRYMEATHRGIGYVELLPNDRERGTSRSLVMLSQSTDLRDGFKFNISGTRVSDKDYFSDFGGSLLVASQRTLPVLASVSGPLAGWNVSTAVQDFQVLQDAASPVLPPYAWLPKLVATKQQSAVQLGGWDNSPLVNWQAMGEVTRFSHPTLASGTRSVATGSVAVPDYVGAVSVTPKITMHATNYAQEKDGSAAATLARYNISSYGSFANNVGTSSGSYSRAIPTASLDAKMTFERDLAAGGRALMQTLEPRLFYVYTPYRSQSTLPVFDSGAAGVNLPQIFSETSFSGQDRVADQNQITSGITTRFMDATTGAEQLRASIAQRFYFDQQRVVLPGQSARTDKESDILGEMSARYGRAWRFDALAQYTRALSVWQGASAIARYNPKDGYTVTSSYRYTRGSLNAVDVAGQLPIANHWYAVARYNVSLQSRSVSDTSQIPGVIEALGGVEYDGGCWVGRMVMQRYRTSADRSTSAIFLQFELNGVARVGPDPLGALSRSIPNYRYINRLTPPPAKYDNYE